MRKRTVIVSFVGVLMFAIIAGIALAYGEGPSNSGRWVYGDVIYSDGSKCRNCCNISLETYNGFSREGCTNDRAEYKIYIASDTVIAVYFRGSKVWSGSRSAKGGTRIDIPAS